jgi:hypothetical protein
MKIYDIWKIFKTAIIKFRDFLTDEMNSGVNNRKRGLIDIFSWRNKWINLDTKSFLQAIQRLGNLLFLAG